MVHLSWIKWFCGYYVKCQATQLYTIKYIHVLNCYESYTNKQIFGSISMYSVYVMNENVMILWTKKKNEKSSGIIFHYGFDDGSGEI